VGCRRTRQGTEENETLGVAVHDLSNGYGCPSTGKDECARHDLVGVGGLVGERPRQAGVVLGGPLDVDLDRGDHARRALTRSATVVRWRRRLLALLWGSRAEGGHIASQRCPGGEETLVQRGLRCSQLVADVCRQRDMLRTYRLIAESRHPRQLVQRTAIPA